MTRNLFALALVSSVLTACASTPAPVETPVVIKTDPVRTCIPIGELERVVIPAKTETRTVVSLIENPPYDPIERTEEFTKVIEPEIVYYVDGDTGAQVTNICQDEVSGAT